MELMQLRYFQVVAANQHITRSAEQLNVSQPAISTVISRLEQELGVPLFDRSGRSILLNEYGKTFLKRVNRILLDIDDSQKELKDLFEQGLQTLSLSVTSPQFLQGIKGFMTTHPDTKWRQSVNELEETIKLLENGKIDIAITSPEIVADNMESIVLFKDEFMIAVHPDHPLAKKNNVTLSDIGDEKFIALQKGFPFRTQTDQLFADLGIQPNIIMECDHYLRAELLNTNTGITMTSRSAKYRHLYDEKIIFLPIKGISRTRIIALTYLKGKYLSRVTKEFNEFIKGYYQHLEE